MYGEERRQAIVLRARAAGRVEVTALAEEYGVATETIRRDLDALERDGLLRRVHGGAIPAERLVPFEAELTARGSTMVAEKARIAKAALEFLPADGAIFVEGGSTPAEFAAALPRDRRLTVVTNGLPTAMALAALPNLTVLTVGGRVRGVTLTEVDDWALRSLADLRVDVAFVGTNGLAAGHGLTTPDPSEAAVKRAALAVGSQTVLLADHSKIGAVSVVRYGALSDVDVLVTDDAVDPAVVDEFSATGLRVVTA